MSRSVLSSVKRAGTTEEEEEPASSTFRYFARTIPAETPFFNSAFLRRGSQYKHNDRDDVTTQTSTTRGGSDRNMYKFFPTPLHTPPEEGGPRRKSTSLPTAETNNPTEFDGTAGYQTTESDDQGEDSEEDEDEDEDDDDEVDDVDYKTTKDFVNNDDESDIDVHGVDHYGKLESKPIRDSQDRLWTDIDALDDVKKLAHDINLYEGFPVGFEEQLEKMRESHAHLLKAMRDRNAKIEEEKRHEITTRTDSQSTNNELLDSLNKNASNSVSRVISNGTGIAGASAGNSGGSSNKGSAGKPSKPSKHINQNYMGATVQADEDKYIQDMVDTIKALRA